MTSKASNIETIETKTGRSWREWVEELDAAGARELDHTTIARHAYEGLEGKIDSAGWWAQAVTVAYEQHIGRRQPGQKNDGSYEVSVTKQLPGEKQEVFARWNRSYGDAKSFNHHAVSNVRSSTTPVRLYFRCDIEGGSKLTVAVEQKTSEKAMIAITHTHLTSAHEKDQWQAFWKQALESF